MKEYIERVAVIPALEDYYEPIDPDRPMTLTLGQIAEVVKNMPASDVVEVRHGRWIPSDMGGGEPDEAYICSECGEPWILNEGTPEENNMRYCPACGARMDKEDEHEVS